MSCFVYQLVLIVLAPHAVLAAYSGDVGWIFTGDDVYNTAGNDAGVGGGDFNTAQGAGTFTLGGTYNSASGIDSFIGGGLENTVEQTAQSSIIGGGEKNLITSRFSIVTGGLANVVTENYGAILGGYKGAISGKMSTIVGGSRNSAAAKISSAFGFKAKAEHEYSLALGFAGTTFGDCETTADNQVSVCCDSWIVNDVELMDVFTRRRHRALAEYSVEVLKKPMRHLAEVDEVDAASIELHEKRVEETRKANAELEETILLLSQEIEALAAAQVRVSEDQALVAQRRQLLEGAEVEYVEDTSVAKCATKHIIESTGSGLSSCTATCDSYGLECGAFLLDDADDCYVLYFCAVETGTAVEGTVYKKQRVKPTAYDVDAVSYVDYQVLLAEEKMDILEYETKWAGIAEYTGGSCSSGGSPYLGMDAANQALYVCDGAGTWTQLSLEDSIPTPSSELQPAPWHGFANITQDVWADTDTHRYVQSGPIEEAIKPHDVDQCESSPCDNGATCVDHGGALTVNGTFDTFECLCTDGFEGITCSDYIDDCTSSPCENAATCTSDTYGYHCACVPGYEGLDCEININECQYEACVHGTCVDGVDSFECICEDGWNGTVCDTLLLSEGYYSLGLGQCVDSSGLLPDKCTSSHANVSTLFDCVAACDATPECDAVQFRHTTSVCALMLANGTAAASIDSHFSCSNNFVEIFRDGFEGGMTDWTIDPDSVLASTGKDTTYVKSGSQSFRMSGGSVVDNTKSYKSSISLTSSDGITNGVEYAVSVWVFHASNIVSGPQPSPTSSSLTVSDSTEVYTSTAVATADARHWELLSVTFTAQTDATLLISLELEPDYLVDTYWDDVIVWTGAGISTTAVDGSLIQDVRCYRRFETPTVSSYESCYDLKYAGEADGPYVLTDADGNVNEHYCRDEFEGSRSKYLCEDALNCYSCSLVVSESGSWALGDLSDGLGQYSYDAAWSPSQLVRLEWFDSSGDWQWVQFHPESSIFQDRLGTTMTNSAEDNIIISLAAENFTTSVTELSSAVATAGGAFFCLSTLDDATYDVDVAWGILPSDHVDFGAGCIGASWAGEGVFYAEASQGQGFVGYKGDGEVKGLTDGADHLDMFLQVCENLNTHLKLWLLGEDIDATGLSWPDHRHAAAAVTLSQVTQDSSTDAYRIKGANTQFDIANLDISPSVMPSVTVAVWVKLELVQDTYGWIVSQDTGSGTYDRGIFLHDSRFGTSEQGNATLVRSLARTLLRVVIRLLTLCFKYMT